MRKAARITLVIMVWALLAFPALTQEEERPVVGIGGDEITGPYLVGPNGFTLYMFEFDDPDITNCYDVCADEWPPLLVTSADEITVDARIPGVVGVIERTDGTLQVTYNSMPLYYWLGDFDIGEVTGDGYFNVWWIVQPVSVYVGGNNDLGSFLVGPTGRTLYTFGLDSPGTSACTDECLTSWPALTVASEEELTAARDVAGELSVIERTDDGTLLVTYNGWPLYYWSEDAAVGDATGQGLGDVWFVVHPETVVVGGNDDLGAFLVGANGRTLYIFELDSPGVSTCVDQCLASWPALVVGPNDVLVAGAGVTGALGTIERADGTLQVTYDDRPLYTWTGDTVPGDATGQGFGDVWFVVPVEEM